MSDDALVSGSELFWEIIHFLWSIFSLQTHNWQVLLCF